MRRTETKPAEEQEELYALLEKAMEEEPRLRVSERLIQKTMKRVEELPEKTVGRRKPCQKWYRSLSYACVAAAAVLVLAVGVRTIGNSGFSVNDTAEKATEPAGRSLEMENGDGSTAEEAAVQMYQYDCMQEPREENTTSETEYSEFSGKTYSLQESSDTPDMAATQDDAIVKSIVYPEQVALSEKLVQMLEERGWESVTEKAVYWSLNGESFTTGEPLLLESMHESGTETADGKTPYFGMDGELLCEQPLKAALQVQTTEGELWLVLAEKLYLLQR